MIRFILVASFVILFLIATILVQIIEYIIGKFNPNLRNKSSLAIIQWAFRVVLFLSGTKLTVIGKENIPDEPVLYVGNHRSFYDIVIGYSLVPNLTGFIAKKEMEKIPLLSHWMRLVNCLFLDRNNIKEGLKTILEGIEKVKQGISIWIFPEGTRNTGSELELMPFKEGSLKIAEKSGCPIIPVAMKGTADIFENQFPKIRKRHVTVTFGEPIKIKKLEKEQKKFLGAYTQSIIEEMLKNS